MVKNSVEVPAVENVGDTHFRDEFAAASGGQYADCAAAASAVSQGLVSCGFEHVWFQNYCSKSWRETCQAKCTERDAFTRCPNFKTFGGGDATRELVWFDKYTRVAVSAAVLRGSGLVDLVVTDSAVQDYDPASERAYKPSKKAKEGEKDPPKAPPIAVVLNVGTKQQHKWMRLEDVKAQGEWNDALKKQYGQLSALPENPFKQLARQECKFDRSGEYNVNFVEVRTDVANRSHSKAFPSTQRFYVEAQLWCPCSLCLT